LACAITIATAWTASYAHHLPKALSHLQGPHVLTEISYYKNGLAVGVPVYTTGDRELGHHELIPLAAGDTFVIKDSEGNAETIRFSASDFEDISAAPLEEVLTLINDRSALIGVDEINAFAVVHGFRGGNTSWLTLADGAGGPLSKLGLSSGTTFGDQEIRLEVSLPAEDDHGQRSSLAGHPFVLLLSRFDGSHELMGRQIPIGADPLLPRTLREAGEILGGGRMSTRRTTWPVVGKLDANEDASTVLRAADLDRLLGRVWPERLYAAVVVLSDDGQSVEYVTNRFVVNVVK
jgi:hypothetical protein